ncbi:ComEC/Rec2 family competence protein [Tabrizicola sp. M-4]|uniref:ComEC/Rec2 family competence protein n=1 Tax=Tabrizicola sp. M-4 TaxID=3055847 RepID=UPI003DA89FC1
MAPALTQPSAMVAGLSALRGRVLLFAPVLLGIGIGLWFALSTEPGPRAYGAALFAVLLCILAALRFREGAPLLVLIACPPLGMLAAGLRLILVAAPMLQSPYSGPITGRIVEIDRSYSGALRITLDQVWLAEIAPTATPARVRISLQGDQRWFTPVPGSTVMVTARLSPPEGPVEPGAFDFRRMAFFEGLGAVGYTRHPALTWQDPAPGEDRIGRLRAHLSDAIRARIPGDAGAFAAGVLTGDRSGLSVEAVEALRDSSLAHLLAISGMNMAFLIAFVFALLRYGLALIPPVALRWNSKKIAAIVSLGVAFFYLLLSGSNVATERAFIMVAVMLVAVLLDRRAITLRSVAIAAILILLWQPEALLSPGFQMSFAATIALIAAFQYANARLPPGSLSPVARFLLALFLSSLVGGIATAPYAAAHFNRFTDYGLLANLLTGPVMGAVVMPAGAVAGLLAPIGLADAPLWVMEQGCRWILAVAFWIAALDGAVTAIPAPPGAVLPLLTLGLCWALLWPGQLRWLGLPAYLAACALWALADRPAILIGGAGIVGVMGPEGRALSRARGEGFLVGNWLENDGDLALQAEAALRPGFAPAASGRSFALGPARGLLLDRDRVATAGDCATYRLIIATTDGPPPAPGCLILGPADLDRHGTIAIATSGGTVTLTATDSSRRLWNANGGAEAPPLPPIPTGQ